MSFKRKSIAKKVIHARMRLLGVQHIDTNLQTVINYGWENRPLTQVEFQQVINDYTEEINAYNQLLIEADQRSNRIAALEKRITKMSTAVLKAASALFGDDASEIQTLGGTRTSDRKKPVRKKKAVQEQPI
jgi:hypothetical protein